MKLVFPIFLFLAIQSKSQTIINYQTWTGATGCNIFSSATNVPATKNGTSVNISHRSTVGQPTYDATNHAVDLDGNVSSDNNHTLSGTEYGISYSFQSGYSYIVTVNASSINSSGDLPRLRLKVAYSIGAVNTWMALHQLLTASLQDL